MSNKKKQKKIKLNGSSFWYKNKPLNGKSKSNFFSIKIDSIFSKPKPKSLNKTSNKKTKVYKKNNS